MIYVVCVAKKTEIILKKTERKVQSMQSPETEVGHQEKKVVVVSFSTTVARQGRERKNLKLDESCMSNSKL